MSLNTTGNYFIFNAGASSTTSFQQKVSECQTRVQSCTQTANEKSSTVTTLNADCMQLTSNLSTKQTLLTTAQSVLDAATELLTSAQGIPVEQTTDDDGNVIEDSSARDAAISQAMSAISEANTQLAAAQAEYEQAQGELTQKEQEVSAAQSEAESANIDLSDANTALASAEQELSEAEESASENQTAQEAKKTGVNGEIDEEFCQQNIGDCGLLTAVLALSQTTDGAENIKNSIEVCTDENGDEYYEVTFQGVGETYSVTADEIKEAKKDNSRLYSDGDDDMTLIELATEKCFENSEDETVRSFYANREESSNDEVDYLNGVNPQLVDYIFTGELGERVTGTGFDEIQDFYSHIDNSDHLYSAKKLSIEDIDGNKVQINANTEYTITAHNDDGTIEIQSPDFLFFSGKTYTISIDELYDADYSSLKSYYAQKHAEEDEMFDEFESNPDENALVFANMSVNSEASEDNTQNYASELTDINGETIYLIQNHAYNVLDVSGDVITLQNPWDTGEEIQVSRKELYKLDSYKLYNLES